MMQFIDAIENSGLARWVRESPSIFSYTTILSLHAMGLAIVVGLNSMVSLRILGVASGIPLAPLRKLFPWMFLGFWINAVSGLVLLAAAASKMAGATIFWIKLGFILLAMINLRLMKVCIFDKMDASHGEALPDIAKKLAFASLLLWVCAIVAGRVIAYPGILGFE